MERIVRRDDKETHERNIREMAKFLDDDKPQLGIFWFNPEKFSLFGVSKKDAQECLDEHHNTYPKLHKTFWQKMHHRAVAKNEKDSIYYKEHNYTLIPRGKVFFEDGKYVVRVGDWFSGLNIEKFSELVQDEFNLPDDFEFAIDEHWDLGRGWSEEKF